ncbi:MAG: DUF5060 domain-containing protein [Fimbriimonas sp.]|nr:DUF5060 domain-containing protein [Fimbriimonas sp.]
MIFLTALYFSIGMTMASSFHATPSPFVSVVPLTPEPMQYGKVEWAVVLNFPLKDPYDQHEVMLDLHLRQPDRREIVIPGYYERGVDRLESIWRLRFAPIQSGSYSGEFRLFTTQGTVSSSSVSFQVTKSKREGFLHVKSDWACVTDSGKLFRGVGYNIGWEARSFDDSKHFKDMQESARYSYEYMLGKLAQDGGNFFRTWSCSWNLPVQFTAPTNLDRYSKATGPINASACARLDELVDLCDRLKLRMMLTVFAGFADWKGSALNAKNGGPLNDPLEFLATPQGRLAGKNALRYFVARWGYSPSIGAWEFFNEIDNFMHGRDPRVEDSVVADWHREMSAYLKSVDPYRHIVTTSISHRPVAGLDSIPDIDINQRHIYKSTNTMGQAVVDGEKRFVKPCVVGEFSYEWDWTKSFDDFKREMDLDFKQGLWIGAFSPTPILPMSWWWEYFDQHGIESYVGRVARFNDLLLRESGGNIALENLKPEGKPLYEATIRTPEAFYVLILNRTFASVRSEVELPIPLNEGTTTYDIEAEPFVAALVASQHGKKRISIHLDPGGGSILRIPR